MNRLILIGNGFDLAHGLKTCYKDFILWYIKGRFDKAQQNMEYYKILRTNWYLALVMRLMQPIKRWKMIQKLKDTLTTSSLFGIYELIIIGL